MAIAPLSQGAVPLDRGPVYLQEIHHFNVENLHLSRAKNQTPILYYSY